MASPHNGAGTDGYNSLDPRFQRSGLPPQHEEAPFEAPSELDQFETYEVFHQPKRGAHHSHVGIVHAPSPEMALLFAKEQYGRRFACVNLWVVPSRYVTATSSEDEDMFAVNTGLDKSYREASAYRTREQLSKARAGQSDFDYAAEVAAEVTATHNVAGRGLEAVDAISKNSSALGTPAEGLKPTETFTVTVNGKLRTRSKPKIILTRP